MIIIASFQLQLVFHFRMLLDLWCLFMFSSILLCPIQFFFLLLLLRLGPIFCALSQPWSFQPEHIMDGSTKSLLIKWFASDYKMIRVLRTRAKWFFEWKKDFGEHCIDCWLIWSLIRTVADITWHIVLIR